MYMHWETPLGVYGTTNLFFIHQSSPKTFVIQNFSDCVFTKDQKPKFKIILKSPKFERNQESE